MKFPQRLTLPVKIGTVKLIYKEVMTTWIMIVEAAGGASLPRSSGGAGLAGA